VARRFSYERGTEEYSRVLAFTDGVFAIAMTLLVVQIDIPRVDPDDLGSAVADEGPLIISFFISFIVIGYYWLAHHRLWALFMRVEPGIMLLNLLYLSVIAFFPHPTGLVGEYENRPLSVIVYAACLAFVSLMEVLMLVRARNVGLLRTQPSPATFRHAVVGSLAPVAVFALSIPIAFYSSTLALLFWIVNYPVQVLHERRRPEDFDEAFN
jgi:uncharacterized membrane protein